MGTRRWMDVSSLYEALSESSLCALDVAAHMRPGEGVCVKSRLISMQSLDELEI